MNNINRQFSINKNTKRNDIEIFSGVGSTSSTFSTKAYVIIFIILLFANIKNNYAAQNIEGACEPEQLKEIYIDASTLRLSDNKKGTYTFIITYQNEYMNIICYSNTVPLNIDYFHGETNNSFPKSTINPDYFKLNDDLDFLPEIALMPYVRAQFLNKEIKFNTPMIITEGTKPYLSYKLVFGDFTVVNIYIRRTLLGGAIIIPEGTILGQFYLYSYSGQKAPMPIAVVKMGGIISAPTICHINDDKIIDVDFDIIDSSKLTTTSASSTLSLDKQLDYSCNNSLNQNISVKLVATASSFDGNAIKTSNNDIGIIMLQNGKPVPPGGAGFATTLKDGKGSDTVTFVPVKSSSANIATGAFSASATLIITAA